LISTKEYKLELMALNILNKFFSKNKRSLTIRVKLDEHFSDTNLQIRYTLADTLEERGIGEVYDEGMGEDFMEVSLDVVRSEKTELKIKAILQSLGLLESSELVYNERES
jgi:hypothetical protein